MRENVPSLRSIAAACAAAWVASLVGVAGARAGDESCRQWLREHADWKAKAMHRTLRGAPQHEIDVAVFEMLQREAYLTSCEVPAHVSRAPMVGWRLVDRSPDDYGVAVLESVLERAGLEMDLRRQLGEEPDAPPLPETAPVFDAFDDGAVSVPVARRGSGGVAR